MSYNDNLMANISEAGLAARKPSIWDKLNPSLGILYGVAPIPIEDLRLPFSLRQHIDYEGNPKYRVAREVYERLSTITYHASNAQFAQYHPDNEFGFNSRVENGLAGQSTRGLPHFEQRVKAEFPDVDFPRVTKLAESIRSGGWGLRYLEYLARSSETMDEKEQVRVLDEAGLSKAELKLLEFGYTAHMAILTSASVDMEREGVQVALRKPLQRIAVVDPDKYAEEIGEIRTRLVNDRGLLIKQMELAASNIVNDFVMSTYSEGRRYNLMLGSSYFKDVVRAAVVKSLLIVRSKITFNNEELRELQEILKRAASEREDELSQDRRLAADKIAMLGIAEGLELVKKSGS